MVRYRDLVSDTICAPITAPGFAGVAVIRVSGDHALEVTKRLVNKPIENIESHQVKLRDIRDHAGQKIDQVLVAYFAKDKSFTGDETIEISCHGNPLIINRIVQTYLEKDCRLAERGEFSFRAFYNGKLDLVQAESIHGLVTTKTIYGSEAFTDQLQGGLSVRFEALESYLVEALANLEASIDFVEEDIDPQSVRSLVPLLEGCLDQVAGLIDSYDTGKSLQDSFKVLLLGAPNVGKSSLFNKLVDAERSIVTDVPGTTRDMVSKQTFFGNFHVEIVDSAGLRETDNPIESEGVKRGLEYSEKADLILYVCDASQREPDPYLLNLDVSRVHLVLNKKDQLEEGKQDFVLNQFMEINGLETQPKTLSFVSAKTNEGVLDLKKQLKKFFTEKPNAEAGEIVTQARHFDHLVKLRQFLENSKSLVLKEESPDLVSQELRFGLSEIYALLGKQYDDEILDKIFSDFCIGK